MEISQLSFVLLSIYSLCFGIGLGIIYDIIRIQRVIFGFDHPDSKKIDYRNIELPIIKKKAYKDSENKILKIIFEFLFAVYDILFMVSFGVIAVLIAYAYNSGRVRLIIFVGLIVGFLAYYFTVGKLVVKLSGLVAFIIRCIAVYLVQIISAPCKMIIKWKKDHKHKGTKKERSKNDVFTDQRKKNRNVA